MANLEELETIWSFDDMLRAEAVMDMFDYHERQAVKEMKNKK